MLSLLIVGVDCDGNVVGIEREEQELKKIDQRKKGQNPDARIAIRELDLELQKYVRSRTYPHGSKSVAHPDCMTVKVEGVGGKRVIVVRVRQARERVWVRLAGKPPGQGELRIRGTAPESTGYTAARSGCRASAVFQPRALMACSSRSSCPTRGHAGCWS